MTSVVQIFVITRVQRHNRRAKRREKDANDMLILLDDELPEAHLAHEMAYRDETSWAELVNGSDGVDHTIDMAQLVDAIKVKSSGRPVD